MSPGHAPEREAWFAAAIVAFVFLIAGTTWIVVTDILVYRMARESTVIARLETAKGWAFVALTTALLFFVTKTCVARIARAEATIRTVVDGIADGVVVLSLERKIADANPAAVRMLGVRSANDLIGMKAEEFTRRYRLTDSLGRLIRPEDLISQRSLRGDAPPPYRARLRPPGKPDVVILASSAPVRLRPNGPVELAVTVMHDVTTLENMDQLRGQFFSAAAHAIKTPLTVIKAQSRLLASRVEPASDPSVLAIERQCGRIDRLTENMLVLLRLRSGSLTLYPETLDLAELVEKVGREMQGASADHAIVVRIEARPPVFVDYERLVQALRNLIEMAYRRAHPREDITVVLSEAGGRARVGLLYDRLSAEETIGEEEGAGFTGLGLERHVVESLLHAMNGTCGCARDDARGGLDWIELPIARAA